MTPPFSLCVCTVSSTPARSRSADASMRDSSHPKPSGRKPPSGSGRSWGRSCSSCRSRTALAPRSGPKPPAKPKPVAMPSPGLTRQAERRAARLAVAEARASERRARQQAVVEKRADRLRARQARRQEAAEERSRRDATIVAATRRGLSTREIATGLGITRERVRQILAREGEPAIPRGQILRPPAPRTAVTCAACGKVSWRAARDFRAGYARYYCGPQCQGAAQRRVTDVQAVLALRAEGASWAAIGRQFHASAQAAQRAVWRHLAQSGQLTAAVVEPLWRTRQPPRWHWLEQSTGHALSVG